MSRTPYTRLRIEGFRKAEASLRLEGKDPSGTPLYESVKARIISSELTYEQERGYVILCSEGWEYMMLQNQEYLDKLSATTEQEIQKAVTYSVRLRDKNEATTELISDGRIAGINMDIGIEEE